MRKFIWAIIAVTICSEMTYANWFPAGFAAGLSSAALAEIKINFQPATSQVPFGYLPDSGLVFADRGNGFSYGWDAPITRIYDRGDDINPDDRYATTLDMERTSAPHGTWEIALDNDDYEVHIVCGDALQTNQINTINVEGTILADPDGADNFDEYNLTVTVSDGRLTISTAPGGINAKLCFLEITPSGLVNLTPIVVAGDDQSLVWPKNRVTLLGSATDDGKGNPDGFLSVQWTQVSGPQGVIFVPGADVVEPQIILPVPGMYTFELFATDGALSASDAVVISILEPTCPVGDLNFDCKVDLADLKLFAERWLTTDAAADFNGADGVNLVDMAFVAQNWLSDWTSTIVTTLTPSGAITAGALWRLDGGIWRSSGAIVNSVMEGEHTIEFKAIPGWMEPPSQSVYSVRQQQYSLSGTYVVIPDQTLIVSEFMAINSNLADLRPAPTASYSTVVEGLTEYPDWIEIRNTTGAAISLNGWFLTDNPQIPRKWRFPNGKQVGANGHFVVYASNKDQWRFPTNYPYVDNSGNLHTNFDLNGDGGYLALVKPDGTIAYEYVDYPKQRGLITYGVGNNSKVGFLKSVTRGTANDAAYDGEVADTKFSVDRGFYTQPISVAIVCDTPGTMIRWTNDQSEPTLTNGNTYTAPIAINKTTSLRAAAFKDNFIPSIVDTHTYLYLDDIITQATDPATGAQVTPVGYPVQWISGSVVVTGDYQMDPDICSPSGLFGSVYSGTIKDDLKAIPTLSLTMPKDDWFGATGIYVNQNQDGTERKVSAEWIDSSGVEPGFQINCGVKMQGGADHTLNIGTSLDRWKTYKLAVRLIFRGGYGPSKLRYKLFPDEPAATDQYDTIVVKAPLSNVWTHSDGTQRARAEYTRDQFTADLQNAMGGVGAHGRAVHLYINGMYWGVYWVHERPDESFASSYFGGLPEDYDVIKHRTDVVLSGTNTSFLQMANLPNTDYVGLQQLLDVPLFQDYMILNYYLGNWDWSGKNWYASHNHYDPAGRWRFQTWDSDHVMEPSYPDVTGNNNGSSSPTGINLKWIANEEYRMLFADRVYRSLYNNGVLSPTGIAAAYLKIAGEIDRAIVGESARWGDNRRATPPYTRNVEWMNERNRLVNTYFPGRRDALVSVFRSKSPKWYPSIDPPLFNIGGVYQHGGNVNPGAVLTLPSTNTVWYTLDGADPRKVPSSGGWSVPESAAKKVWVARNNTNGSLWTGGNEPFDDSVWTDGTPIIAGKSGAVGYEINTSDPISYDEAISYDVKSVMYGASGYTCAYIRIPFTLTTEQLTDLGTLTLKVRYDDGYVAYINGSEVSRSSNLGSPGSVVAYNATISRSGDPAGLESFDISAHLGKLHPGSNILAFHGVNASKTNSDFVISAELAGVKTVTVSVSPTAIRYSSGQPPVLNLSRPVKARAITAGGEWSALNETVFAVGPVKESLRITEIMYNPADPNCEFIELKNIGTQAINLNLVKFSNGIDFTFGDLTLAPNAYTLVVQNAAEFAARYGAGLPVAGQYVGLLENAGERIRLVDAIGAVIHDFDYKDGWFDITDGQGFSLTILNAANPNPLVWGQKIGWRPSSVVGGSPGSDDSGIVPPPGAIVLNEILPHSHGGEITPDWIELYNTTANPINIGGWFLSDSNADDPNMKKYQIAEDTMIDGYGYKVFYQDLHFGNTADPGCRIPFALSEGGEAVYLRSGLAGALTGYVAEQDFGAAESGVAFGRYIKSELAGGGMDFVAMDHNTPDGLNSGPKIGPIVFTEIMYNPNTTNSGDEYIELKNISSAPVTLQDAVGTETTPGVFTTTIVPWRFTDGIDFVFPTNTTIPAGGLLIVAKDKAKLKAYYGAAIPGNVTILQWTTGSLDNGGEKIRLSRPGDFELGQPDRFWIREEQVTYDDLAPWPIEPDGTGKVLKRINPAAYGNDAANWQAASPTPGQ